MELKWIISFNRILTTVWCGNFHRITKKTMVLSKLSRFVWRSKPNIRQFSSKYGKALEKYPLLMQAVQVNLIDFYLSVFLKIFFSKKKWKKKSFWTNRLAIFSNFKKGWIFDGSRWFFGSNNHRKTEALSNGLHQNVEVLFDWILCGCKLIFHHYHNTQIHILFILFDSPRVQAYVNGMEHWMHDALQKLDWVVPLKNYSLTKSYLRRSSSPVCCLWLDILSTKMLTKSKRSFAQITKIF